MFSLTLVSTSNITAYVNRRLFDEASEDLGREQTSLPVVSSCPCSRAWANENLPVLLVLVSPQHSHFALISSFQTRSFAGFPISRYPHASEKKVLKNFNFSRLHTKLNSSFCYYCL